MTKKTYKHWKLITDEDAVAWLHVDQANTSTNSLSAEVLNELTSIVDELEADPPKGLIILSDKPSGFIAGADIKELRKAKDVEQAREFIRLGQGLFSRIENLRFPTVSVIHGFCLGGGLELALACRYRIADDDPKTRLGLPEVNLGIFPAFGGSTRLPLLIGALAAMDLMLTGRTISAQAARKIGVVDYATPNRHLNRAAKQLMLKPPPVKHLGGWKAYTNHPLVRPLLAKIFRKQLDNKISRDHYPAPYALVDLWSQHGSDKRKMLEGEEKQAAQLVVGETAQNLIRVFFLQEQLKSLGDKSVFTPKRVHVIGAGVMGGDIAAWCAMQGLSVTLQDRNEAVIASALKRAYGLYQKRFKKPYLIQQVMDRLIPDVQGLGLAHADVVIEAIVENLEAKQQLFKTIEPKMKADAVLATNTSSIPLDALSEVLKDPGRLVGIHFFNPVAKMQLVEIIHADKTDKQTIAKASAFTRHISRLPLPVKSSPGFLVNRVLMPYLIEAVVMESEGVSAAVIDAAALKFGMPMGPIALADTVGLDICLSVAEILSQKMQLEVPKRLRNLVEAGRLGRKSGHGFYLYKKGKPLHAKASKTDYSPADVQDRLMLRMINEVVACVREGIVESNDLIDAGVIFATGFAPFRGGPLHFRDTKGLDSSGNNTLYNKLVKLEENLGARFKPDAGWTKVNKNEKPNIEKGATEKSNNEQTNDSHNDAA